MDCPRINILSDDLHSFIKITERAAIANGYYIDEFRDHPHWDNTLKHGRFLQEELKKLLSFMNYLQYSNDVISLEYNDDETHHMVKMYSKGYDGNIYESSFRIPKEQGLVELNDEYYSEPVQPRNIEEMNCNRTYKTNFKSLLDNLSKK